jgi:hypothetical protein
VKANESEDDHTTGMFLTRETPERINDDDDDDDEDDDDEDFEDIPDYHPDNIPNQRSRSPRTSNTEASEPVDTPAVEDPPEWETNFSLSAFVKCDPKFTTEYFEVRDSAKGGLHE